MYLAAPSAYSSRCFSSLACVCLEQIPPCYPEVTGLHATAFLARIDMFRAALRQQLVCYLKSVSSLLPHGLIVACLTGQGPAGRISSLLVDARRPGALLHGLLCPLLLPFQTISPEDRGSGRKSLSLAQQSWCPLSCGHATLRVPKSVTLFTNYWSVSVSF